MNDDAIVVHKNHSVFGRFVAINNFRYREIQGNLLTLGSTPTVDSRILIIDNPENLDLARPDVGGDAYEDAADAFFTIVWQRIWNDSDSDIVMRRMTFDGVLSVADLYCERCQWRSRQGESRSRTLKPA